MFLLILHELKRRRRVVLKKLRNFKAYKNKKHKTRRRRKKRDIFYKNYKIFLKSEKNYTLKHFKNIKNGFVEPFFMGELPLPYFLS